MENCCSFQQLLAGRQVHFLVSQEKKAKARGKANRMKSFIPMICLLLALASVSVECRPKRSVVLTAPVVAAGVPVVRTAAVVHSNPTTVVKTEQVHSGHGTSYSYSTETKAVPVVHHTAVAAAAPVVAQVPAAAYSYYPAASYYSPYYYSPYHYVVGK